MKKPKKAVFICGCQRSGTTLLGSLLGGSPTCITTPESQFITDVAAKIDKEEISNTIPKIKKALIDNYRFKIWGINPDFRYINHNNHDNISTEMIWQCIDLYAEKNGKKNWDTWIDHTPEHINYIDFLSKNFSNSYFIHMLRDGRGVFASVKPLDWGESGVIRSARWWSMNIATALAAEKAFENKMIRIRFEDLIVCPERELRKICNFVNIEFKNSMLNGNGFIVPKYSKNQHALIGKAPDQLVSDKWKKNLTHREIEIFEYLSGALLNYLGYELYYGMKATPPTYFEKYSEVVLTFFDKLLNLLRRYYRRKNV